MEKEKFYKTVEGIFLFPGSLYELNSSRKEKYEIYPKNISSLQGMAIPSEKDMGELTKILFELFGFDEESIPNVSEFFWDTFYHDERIQNVDLRIKAKKLGANGLIRYKPFSKLDMTFDNQLLKKTTFDIFMGIPVKIVGKS
ncbi:MAG: hypothetical protein NUV46_03850 [Nanoarchaeota archaeon]|nr:hypothetical protein [Nanoarchaeota archaeon]